MPNSNDPEGMPTGPLTDHELAHCVVALPDHFTTVRLAKEVTKGRRFFLDLREIMDSAETNELKLVALADVLEEFARSAP